MGYFAWSLIFLLFAIVAGLFGYGGIVSASAGVSKVIFYILLVIFTGLLITGIVTRGAVRT